MIRKNLLLFGLLGLLFQCNQNKKDSQKTDKVQLIFAENISNFGLGGSTKFQIYTDSTYELEVIEEGFNHQKIDKFKGNCFIKNDTVYFNPLEFKFTNSEKAIIKNKFIEFIDGEFPFRIKIKKTSIIIKQTIDFGQFNGYSIFTYDKRFYNYFENDVKQYELTQKDLFQADKILEKCFEDNKTELNRKSSQYAKQIIAVTNSKNEIELWVSCNCKDKRFENEFEYQIMQVHDGGNCHFRLKINLTKQSYSDLSINGEA
jgi:hypothetical protein